ncbi:iron-sulfur assembly protein IscA-like 2, mitochondrial [Dioscorea cayenensis subsp. rotundata]|uniref:Iron-sulfur assembly protein IscA-like 2, mitochondrial n=1 Tax=Dioscorea cayennensis subsp. rotundata TaxID=55577 RepID=A0AB40BJ82_DIOCR|nr:iron-sulfur assembly protein IscA-like 2, mitochondrial [Dioscorea cayenensis subsp. rotundata]
MILFFPFLFLFLGTEFARASASILAGGRDIILSSLWKLQSARKRMSRSVLRRMTASIYFSIGQNHRLLSIGAVESSSSLDAEEAVHMTENCIRRLKELHAKGEFDKMLRLSVETGGCSGFQYAFLLDNKKNSDDRIFEKDGAKLVVDNISYDFVKGATVDYVEELIRSAFLVTTNPSAVGGCSCKSSFMVK